MDIIALFLTVVAVLVFLLLPVRSSIGWALLGTAWIAQLINLTGNHVRIAH